MLQMYAGHAAHVVCRTWGLGRACRTCGMPHMWSGPRIEVVCTVDFCSCAPYKSCFVARKDAKYHLLLYACPCKAMCRIRQLRLCIGFKLIRMDVCCRPTSVLDIGYIHICISLGTLDRVECSVMGGANARRVVGGTGRHVMCLRKHVEAVWHR